MYPVALVAIFSIITSVMSTSTSYSFTSILIPLYIYPSPGAWDPLFKIIKNYGQQPFTVIVNPDSGPGTARFPDSNYVAGIIKLKSFRNVRVIGYVHVSYTSRNISEVCDDIDKYADWAAHPTADIRVSGVFVDEAPAEVGNEDGNLNYMSNVHDRVLQSFGAIGQDGFTMTNPGTIADKGFYQFADAVVSFESPLSSYYAPDTLQTSKDLSKSAGTAASLQGIIVTAFDGSEARERYMLHAVVARGIGYVYFTRDPDYQKFGTDLKLLVGEVAKRNGLANTRRE
ncbi:Spherulin-4 [Dactylellina cionopaga]|nr:Spherulin-4 [Dactylellina cionopaga]